MTMTFDTLGKAALHQMLLTATCRRCGRQAKFVAEDLARVYGSSRNPHTLPFKCMTCDAKDCEVRLMGLPFDRKPDTIIWRPTKGRR